MVIVDAHTHVGNFRNDFAPIHALAERLNYDKFAVLSLQCAGRLLQNLTCALCKAMRPKTTYAFGGLDYLTGRDFASQAAMMREMGFDGIKMLEGKPTTRRLLGNALDDPMYDGFFSYLEETGFPVLLHIVDPPEFWDKDKVPDWAEERGWYYGENDVPYGQYYEEIERMLNKHPKLKAIFAHFYFLSGEPDKAQKFLDDHPSVSIDITAGIEMYENFSKDPKFWREFFIKNSDRIIFGTDSSDSDPDDGEPADSKVDLSGYAGMEIDFVRFDKDLEIYDKKLHGLGLPDDVLQKIFAENYYGYAGREPKKLNAAAITNEAEFLRGFMKKEKDVNDLEYIAERLKKIL